MSERFETYSPSAIRDVVGFADLVEPVERAFAAFSQGLGESPIVVFAPAGSDGDVHVKSAFDNQITLAKLVGLGVQDLAAAEVTLRLLRAGPPYGRRPPPSAQDLR
ncbi:hypothetical protein [Kribbella capetownensis]|uniref:hypothetical protein n=1 Tax=Kribbella capetownensis TaxID=1572659 RepID=UPI00192DC49F|nr:hypothetical protein [Kribbella capetownensis]